MDKEKSENSLLNKDAGWVRGEVIWKVPFFWRDMVVTGGQKPFDCNQFPLGTWQWFPLGKEWVTKAPAGMSAPILSVPSL